MKKTLLIIGLTIFTFTTVNAQKRFDFGVKGGINFSNMTSDYFAENDSKTGFYIGLVAEIPFSDKFSIQPEIFYSTLGADVKIMLYGGGPLLTEYSLDYILVPILAKVYLSNNWSIEFGPSFNFLINGEAYRPTLPDVIDGNEIIQQKYKDANGNSFEFSGVLGVSYKFKGDFFGSVRYFQGLTDSIETDTKNNGFQLGIGFMF
ncbi:porin family protein [Lutibacter sp.]|uniref:porin family protein n=1 Tax=Lutibacter sp. TaxID=1925666 RepID=UPI0025BC9F81|nr:porin family protein [Lutibacter sp.]MCF6169155.1 PorT family protein [Lutibacter sp.]